MKQNILVALVSLVILSGIVVVWVDTFGLVLDIPAIVGVIAPIVFLTAVVIWQVIKRK